MHGSSRIDIANLKVYYFVLLSVERRMNAGEQHVNFRKECYACVQMERIFLLAGEIYFLTEKLS